MEKYIEETEKFLIEKYGEPGEKIENGYKIKQVNLQLDAFRVLIKALKKAILVYEIENYETAMMVICDFAKNDDCRDLEKTAKRIKNLVSHKDSGLTKCGKKEFENFFNELTVFANSKDYNPARIIIFIEQSFKVKKYSFNDKSKSLLV